MRDTRCEPRDGLTGGLRMCPLLFLEWVIEVYGLFHWPAKRGNRPADMRHWAGDGLKLRRRRRRRANISPMYHVCWEFVACMRVASKEGMSVKLFQISRPCPSTSKSIISLIEKLCWKTGICNSETLPFIVRTPLWPLSFKETKYFFPAHSWKFNIVGSLSHREVTCLASNRQGSNFWRAVPSHSSHHPQEFSWPGLVYMCTKAAQTPIFSFIVPIESTFRYALRQERYIYKIVITLAEC